MLNRNFGEKKINIILASTSIYRKSLLERLVLDFETRSPQVDEYLKSDESIPQMVVRLAREKAENVVKTGENSLIIGSDQAADCDGELIGKPGGFEQACSQLSLLSGKTVNFYTGLCVINTETNAINTTCIDTVVHVRTLDSDEIERYVKKEQPYHCAGSFKSEAAGITLLERIESDDPTALIGLPLIALGNILRLQGLDLP